MEVKLVFLFSYDAVKWAWDTRGLAWMPHRYPSQQGSCVGVTKDFLAE